MAAVAAGRCDIRMYEVVVYLIGAILCAQTQSDTGGERKLDETVPGYWHHYVAGAL